ncbi:MAG: ABC transporter substrate-binding protein [Hyphomicrobiaceae bacterium]|nr:ABC transporter substrate-binding protein [Hyphomicrobiaceae bacterium]
MRFKMSAVLGFAVTLGLVSFEARAQELKIGLMAEPSSIDPHFHLLTPNMSTLSHVYERLVHVAPDGALLPGLAESWKTINDTTWEFKLKAGVKWHDGKPFTADDVVFSILRAPNVPNSPASFASVVKGKTPTKIDDVTVHITTAQAFPLMAETMASLMIVSKAAGEGAKTEDYNSGKAAIGTGPYKFAEYVPGDKIVLTRNDAYHGKKALWDKLTFKPIKAAPARVAALLAGDVDVVEDVPTTDIEKLKKDGKVDLVQTVSRRLIYFHMDQSRDETPFVKGKDGAAIKNPFKDARVRMAMSKAINREAIVSRVMEGAAIPASQLMADQFPGTSKTLKPVAYDPEGAKKLLAEAGFPAGFKLTLHGPNGRYTNDVKIAEAVAQMLTRIGVETAVETLPPATFFSRASAGAAGNPEFSFILVGWSSDTGEVSGSLKPLLGSFNKDKGTGAANRARYSNPALDQMIASAEMIIDPKARNEALAKASEFAMQDTALLPSHYPVSTWGLKKGLKYPGRVDEYTNASDITR